MNNQKDLSIFPRQMLLLSGSSLKLLAVLIMVTDHTASILFKNYPPALMPLLTVFGRSYSVYRIMRNIGRLAFPLYCFLIVEGLEHTHNRFRYGLNLFLFALISEIPWNLGMGKSLHHRTQNVYFTLLLGFLAICLIEYFEENRLMQTICVGLLLIVSILLRADYSYRGYVFLLIMYWLRKNRPGQAVIGTAWLKYEWCAGFAFIFINMYNGQRGFIRSNGMKYLFYAIYPVHILVLAFIRDYIW